MKYFSFSAFQLFSFCLPMPTNFQRLKAGQPWRVTQQTSDAILAAAEDYARHSRDPDFVPPPEYLFQGNVIQVRNDSGNPMPRFSVAGLNAPLIMSVNNLQEFQNYPRFSVSKPTAANSGNFCILVEPLGAGQIGLAMVSGVVPCQLYRSQGDTQPTFADVTPGQIGWLTGAPAGARVLWCDQLTPNSPNYTLGTISANGSTPNWGTPWALVRLPESGPAIPTVLYLNGIYPTGGYLGTSFNYGSTAGLNWQYINGLSGLPLASANTQIKPLTSATGPSVKLLKAGVWDLTLELNQGTPPGFGPSVTGLTLYNLQWQVTLLATSPGGSPGDMGGLTVYIDCGSNLVGSGASGGTYWQWYSHRHFLLDCPTNTQLSMLAQFSSQVPYTWSPDTGGSIYATVSNNTSLRLSRLGPSQSGYT